MKILISISGDRTLLLDEDKQEFLNQARRFFSEKAIHDAFNQPADSTLTVVFMSPEEYLELVDDGDVYLDKSMVQGFIDKDVRYSELPYLGVETDAEDGSIYVSLDGRDHKGRRMMKSLLGLGIEKVPVVINSLHYDDGPAYRWGMTPDRPKTLEGVGDSEFQFPVTETYS